MIHNPNDLVRFTAAERTIHWIVALCFILLAASGLSFFHPAFWPFTQLFGGGVWTRILHPFIGLLIAIAFCLEFLNFRTLNRMTSDDWEWIKRIGDLVAGNGQNMPAQEKFNAGQKLLFWAMAVCILLLLVSGLIIWRAYISLPVTLVRLASLVHSAAGALMIGLILGHIYAAIWTRGAIQAMLYGTVTRAWAKHHHKRWYRQMTGG